MSQKKREVIHSQARQVIYKVINFFETEKSNRGYTYPVEQVILRAAAATGSSVSTVRRIKLQGNKAQSTSTKIRTPKKARKKKIKFVLDGFGMCTLRKIIYNIYNERKEVPTLKKILAAAKEEMSFNCSRDTLRKLMRDKLGFPFQRVRKNLHLPMEHHEIRLGRIKYLERLKKNDDLGKNKKPVVYVDEMWIDFPQLNWIKEHLKEAGFKNNSPSHRWLLMHAGGDMGFIKEAEWLHKTEANNTEHRDEISKERFIKWLKETLIPNLPQNSIVVLDNAPYHSAVQEKKPKCYSRRSEMVKWLRDHNVDFEEDMLRSQLYELIKVNKPPRVDVVDTVLNTAGHEVLRLPANHSDLSPIEYIWKLIKQKIADSKVQQFGTDLEQVVSEALTSVTNDDWEKEVSCVKQLEKDYWEREMLLDKNIEVLLWSTDVDSEETDSSSSGGSSDSSENESDSEMSGEEILPD